MNPTHAHLFMNHLPFLGSAFTFIFLMYSFHKKNNEFIKLFLWVFVFFAVLTIPVFLTGDPAGEVVKNIPGIKEELVDNHETAGYISLILIEVTGALALLGIYLMGKNSQLAKWFKYTFVALSFVSIVSFGWTANLGGQIRHSEIRTSNQVELE
jgi:uncharacterized membrane-anchored protein